MTSRVCASARHLTIFVRGQRAMYQSRRRTSMIEPRACLAVALAVRHSASVHPTPSRAPLWIPRPAAGTERSHPASGRAPARSGMLSPSLRTAPLQTFSACGCRAPRSCPRVDQTCQAILLADAWPQIRSALRARVQRRLAAARVLGRAITARPTRS